jgi:predicted metal-dependent HD superfamily phosphohydrolase
LVLATQHTRGATLTNDEALLVDIDLSILGRSEYVFHNYECQIWREYEKVVPREQFRIGRAKVLESFLSRPVIYNTEFFRAKYEEQARKNLTRSLERLKLSK